MSDVPTDFEVDVENACIALRVLLETLKTVQAGSGSAIVQFDCAPFKALAITVDGTEEGLAKIRETAKEQVKEGRGFGMTVSREPDANPEEN